MNEIEVRNELYAINVMSDESCWDEIKRIVYYHSIPQMKLTIEGEQYIIRNIEDIGKLLDYSPLLYRLKKQNMRNRMEEILHGVLCKDMRHFLYYLSEVERYKNHNKTNTTYVLYKQLDTFTSNINNQMIMASLSSFPDWSFRDFFDEVAYMVQKCYRPSSQEHISTIEEDHTIYQIKINSL